MPMTTLPSHPFVAAGRASSSMPSDTSFVRRWDAERYQRCISLLRDQRRGRARRHTLSTTADVHRPMFHHRVEAGRTTSLSHPSSRRRTSYDRYLLLQYDAPSFSNDPIPLPGQSSSRSLRRRFDRKPFLRQQSPSKSPPLVTVTTS